MSSRMLWLSATNILMNKELKILFICGSLEYGKDGVGDYTRRLACQLNRFNHNCQIIALMDKYCSIKFEDFQSFESITVKTLRLPFSNGYKSNTDEGLKFINAFNPEIISLQFVPFSFHNKGLPFWLNSSITAFSLNRNCHIMFHELWVGMERGTSIKHFLWGVLQKRIIKSFLKVLNNKVVHTQTSLYKSQLVKLNFNVHLLPLFSNLEFEKFNNLPPNPSSYNSILSKKYITCAIFGEIHHGAPVNLFTKELSDLLNGQGIKVTLLILGKCGKEFELWKSAFILRGFKVNIVGWQSSQDIVSSLSSSDFGITTTPYPLVDKSGSVAVMQTIGIPVICVARTWKPRVKDLISVTSMVHEYKEGNLKYIFQKIKEIDSSSQNLRHIETIAQQFLQQVT